MLIYELVKPGRKVVQNCQNANTLISKLIDSFYEANYSLIQFLNSRHEMFKSEVMYTLEACRKEAFERLEIPYPSNSCFENVASFLQEGIDFKRNEWVSGIQPNEFRFISVTLSARSFVGALDSFSKYLAVLSKEEGSPEGLDELHEELLKKFPNLRDIRNTIQHMEDRTRHLGAKGKKIEVKPIDTPLFKSDGGIFAFNVVTNTAYGNTMSNGEYGQIDISPASMEELQLIMKKLFYLFNWEGPPEHFPGGDNIRNSLIRKK